MVKDRSVNKSVKRDNLLKDVVSDISFGRQKTVNGGNQRHANKGLKPTTKSVEVSPPKLIGHYQTDIFGKNLVMDGCGGIRVYSLPVEVERMEENKPAHKEYSDNEAVVDDWEQLAENSPSSERLPQTEVLITDTTNLHFDLLEGYIPMIEGGNKVGFSGKIRDRTAGMRWLIKHHQKLKCVNGTRLFDIDFFAGNGALRSIMTSQFSVYSETIYIAVILYKGTYFVFAIDLAEEEKSELNNKRSFAGLRFEDFVSRGINGDENKPSSGDQNNYTDAAKYYNVVRFNFDIFQMVVTGEVDCVIPGSSAALGKPPKVDEFIEIKTSAPLEDKYDQTRMSWMFRCGKISSWFAQCCLMGVKHIVVGIRDEENDKMTCKRTHAFTLEELRRNSNGSWSKNRCFDHLKKFLYFVKETVVEDTPEIFNIFVVKDGIISEPVKKKRSDNYGDMPDISEVVELMQKL